MNYTVTKLEESLDRPGIFRGELNFSGKYLVEYLIETSFSQEARVISNITIPKSNLTKPPISVNGVSVPITTTSKLIPTPVPNEGYNVLYML